MSPQVEHKDDVVHEIESKRSQTGFIRTEDILEVLGKALEEQLEFSCSLLCQYCYYGIQVDESLIHHDENGVRTQCTALILRSNIRMAYDGMSNL